MACHEAGSSLEEPLATFATTLLAILAVGSRAALDGVDRHLGRVFAHVPPNAPAFPALNVGEPPLDFLEVVSPVAHRHLLPDWEIDPHIQRSGPGAEAHFRHRTRDLSPLESWLPKPSMLRRPRRRERSHRSKNCGCRSRPIAPSSARRGCSWARKTCITRRRMADRCSTALPACGV